MASKKIPATVIERTMVKTCHACKIGKHTTGIGAEWGTFDFVDFDWFVCLCDCHTDSDEVAAKFGSK